MRKHIKIFIIIVKEHPLFFGICFASGCVLAYLIEIIIKDISKGIQQGSFNSLNVVALVGTVAGLVSLGWQIVNRYISQPNINGSVEIIDKEGIPEKIVLEARNYGKTVYVNRTGFAFLDSEHEYYQYHTGLVRTSLRSGGILYTEEFDIQEVVQRLIKHNTSLKYAFIEDDNAKQYIVKISREVIEKIDIIKRQLNISPAK